MYKEYKENIKHAEVSPSNEEKFMLYIPWEPEVFSREWWKEILRLA